MPGKKLKVISNMMGQVNKEVKAPPSLLFYKLRKRIEAMQKDLSLTLDPTLYRSKFVKYAREIEVLKNAFKVLLKDYVINFEVVIKSWSKQYVNKNVKALEKVLSK